MAGLYLHVPYCRKACTYCDFHFSTQLSKLPAMVEAMQNELRARWPQGHPMATWYWGGGTPSVLPAASMEALTETLRRQSPLQPGGEFTLEANPEDLSADHLAAWRRLGINRLSVGVQTFVDARLAWMNRAHTGRQAQEGIARAQDAGFENISLDLIYGLPGTSLGEWQDNVGMALDLGTPHLSTYALTVEERTALHHAIQSGKTASPDDARASEDFLWLRKHLRSQGWDPYEISNASLPGWRAQHNSAYWAGETYLGIGPGAHSFDGHDERRWNLPNNARYLKAWAQTPAPPSPQISSSESEHLSPLDRLNERIMTSLRRAEGLSRGDVGDHARALDCAWETYVRKGWMLQTAEAWSLTDEGLLWMDRIAADGFVSAEDLP
jgi:oxygen-independent coproporphyrinogen-3 oxidase